MTDIPMKLPTRPAPEPPILQSQKRNGYQPVLKETFNDRDQFLDCFKLSRSQSAGKLGGYKKPPPRPPPPSPMKLIMSSSALSSYSKQSTHMVPSTFLQNKTGGCIPKSQTYVAPSETKKDVTTCGMLIDFSSPPSSPTLTAHSSSSSFSVNSFGSDNVLTGTNSAGSQFESGFEDDFDLLMVSTATTPSTQNIWGDDPFFKTRSSAQIPVPFDLSNEDPRNRHKESNYTSVSSSIKPTIIRPKNSKPMRPPPPKVRPASTPPTFVNSPSGQHSGDWSPPMPNCPPPPPPEVSTTLERPSIPQRPSTLIQENAEKKMPYCVALYDYNAGHSDDLSFKANDIIQITEKVNDDWLRGRINDTTGLFPANYTNIVIPLENASGKCKYVIALYTFRPETWDDLPFQEGETVKVTKRINDHWLYGECNGRQGQFPENFVTDVSSFLPSQFANL